MNRKRICRIVYDGLHRQGYDNDSIRKFISQRSYMTLAELKESSFRTAVKTANFGLERLDAFLSGIPKERLVQSPEYVS